VQFGNAVVESHLGGAVYQRIRAQQHASRDTARGRETRDKSLLRGGRCHSTGGGVTVLDASRQCVCFRVGEE